MTRDSTRDVAISESQPQPVRGPTMMPRKTIIAPHGGGGRPGWIRPILLAGAVQPRNLRRRRSLAGTGTDWSSARAGRN